MYNKAQLSKDRKLAKEPKKLARPKDIDYVSMMGYRDDSPFKDRPYIDINTPDGTIDMSNTGIDLIANGRFLPKYSGLHQFDTPVVREERIAEFGGTIMDLDDDEIALYRAGGYAIEELPQQDNGGVYSKDIQYPAKHNPANSFTVTDPRSMQDGGGYEIELTDEEIDQYRKGGYVVEELPQAQKGKTVKPFVTSDPYEFKLREAAYNDSLWLYKNNLTTPVKHDPEKFENMITGSESKSYPYTSKVISSSKPYSKHAKPTLEWKGGYDPQNPLQYYSSPAIKAGQNKSPFFIPGVPANKPIKYEHRESRWKPHKVTGTNNQFYLPWEDRRDDDVMNTMDYARFKKPVQPVVFQSKTGSSSKSKTKSKNTSTSNKSYNELYEDPPIYLSDPNDPRIGRYTEAGRQFLYKEPTKAKPVQSKPEVGKLPTKKLTQTPEIIPSNYNYTPQEPETIRTASRSQTVMEPDPNREGKFKVKELRQVPYSANFPGEGWLPMNAPRVMYYNPTTGEETEERFQRGGLIQAQLGLITSPFNLPADVKHPMQVSPNKPTVKRTGRTYDALNDVKPVVADNTKDVTVDQAVFAKQVNDYMASDEYKAEQKAKKDAQAQFEKEQWDRYNKMSLGEKALDRTNAALNQPLLMAANLVMGDQAYIPGMAEGLGEEGPDYDKWLKATGQERGLGVNDVFNAFNPGNWGGHAGREFGKGNYVQGASELGLGLLGLKGAPLLGSQLAKSSADNLINLEQKAGQAYNKVATGNSRLPYAWKMEQPITNTAAIKNSRTLTNEEAEILRAYKENPYSVNRNPEYRKILDNIAKTSSADLSQTNQPLTRINNYYVAKDVNPKLSTSYGQTITYPSQRSWSLGEGITEGYANTGRQRLVIPTKYAKEAQGFHALDYTDPRLATNNIDRAAEKEIFGNVPEGYKVIGKSNEGGFENIFIKPNTKFSKELPGSPNAFTRSGLGGMDMSNHTIKNVDYYTQLLNTYDKNIMPAPNRKFYKDLIATVKKQDGLVTERQLNQLKRLATGNFDFGSKGYNKGYEGGGYVDNQMTHFQDGGPKDAIIYPPGDSEYISQPPLNYDILEMLNQKARREYEQYWKDQVDPTNLNRTSPAYQQKFRMKEGLVEAQDGGKSLPNDYNQFINFTQTLPSNLQDSEYQYGNPDQYDLYGMWESVGKPQSFKDVQDSEYFPLQDNGEYNGFTVGSNGVFLKPMSHDTTWKEVMNSQLNTDPYFKANRLIKNEEGRLQYVPNKQDGGNMDPGNNALELHMFYDKNNFATGGTVEMMTDDEIKKYRDAGYVIIEEPDYE